MLYKDSKDIIITWKLASPRISDLKSLMELLNLIVNEATIKFKILEIRLIMFFLTSILSEKQGVF